MTKMIAVVMVCAALAMVGCSYRNDSTGETDKMREQEKSMQTEQQSAAPIINPVDKGQPAATPVPSAEAFPLPKQENKEQEIKNAPEDKPQKSNSGGTPESTGNTAPPQKPESDSTNPPAPVTNPPYTAPTSEPAPAPTEEPAPAPTVQPTPEPKEDIAVCNTCGKEMTINDIVAHGKSHTLSGENFSYYVK